MAHTPAQGFADHAAYLASVPDAVRPILQSVLQQVRALIPDARPCISYQMPALRAGPGAGKIFFYCAAFKRHIGVFPPVTVDAALVAELAPWRNQKGNLSFPLNQPVPVALIGRVALALAAQYTRPASFGTGG